MPVFNYVAYDENQSKFASTYRDIADENELKCELDKMGYTLVSAQKYVVRKPRRERVRIEDIATFTYKLAGMCSTGLSVIRCLETLEEQTENSTFKYIICDIKESIKTGSSIHDAFAKHSNVFNDFFLGMMEAGESSGKLSETLELCANQLEKQVDLRHKVKSAFTYPVVVGIVCLAVVTSLLIFVVPIFANLYTKLHVELPGPTKALVFTSSFFKQWGWLVLFLIAGTAIFFKNITSNKSIRLWWDSFKLKVPFFSKIIKLVLVARFIRTFALLSSVGVPFVDALKVSGKVADNVVLKNISDELQHSVNSGNALANSMRAYNIFPRIIIQLASSGEEAGMLPEMLNKGVDIIEKDLDRAITALIVKLEPALTVIMGLIIGVIMLGVYIPMFDYMNQIK